MRGSGRVTAAVVFLAALAVFSWGRGRVVALRASGQAQAMLLAGDEPSYLLLAHSIVTDRDVNLYNNCLGRDGRFFGYPKAGGHGARKDMEKKEIFSIHTPGLPLLIAPAYALGLYGPLAPRAAVCLFMNTLAALLVANIYLLCREMSPPGAAAWPALAGAAAVALTPPLVFYSNLIYPELPGALLILFAFRNAAPFARGASPARLLTASLALAFLPWLSFRFLLPALAILPMLFMKRGGGASGRTDNGAVNLRSANTGRGGGSSREARGRACAAPIGIAGIFGVSIGLLLAYQYRAFGTFSLAAGYAHQDLPPGEMLRGAGGFFGLMLDRRYGLLIWSPVYALSLTGILLMFKEQRSAGACLLLTIGAIYLPAALFYQWWGCFAPPPRFTVALAPLLGGVLCYALSRRPRPSFLAVFSILLAASVLVGAVGCRHPSWLYRRRQVLTNYPLLESADRLYPSFFIRTRYTWPLAAGWCAALLAVNGVFLLRWDSSGRG